MDLVKWEYIIYIDLQLDIFVETIEVKSKQKLMANHNNVCKSIHCFFFL